MSATQTVEVRLDALAFGGDAVGRDAGGRVVFVPGGAPGDRVEVRLTEVKKAWARGELVRVVEAGRRVEPPCPIAGECGGCPWMHVAPEAQLAAKQAIVARALARSGATVEPIVAAPAWLGHRRRAKLTARRGAVGFQARRSHRVVDVAHCPALEPPLDAALATARRALGDALGDGGTLSGLVAEDGRVQLAIDPGEPPARDLAERARALVGKEGIVGVLLGERAFGAPLLALAGGLRTSAAGFQQANAAQNEVLRARALEWLLPDPHATPRVLELYAGDGNFTLALASRAHVTAVEGEPRAAARLADNLRPFPDARVRAEPSERAVAELARAGETFDAVLLDPPRAGAAELVGTLPRLGAARIVYVSCDPMTLARDVARLEAQGYRAVRAQPIDLMPHTSHIETVVLLERK